MVLSFLVDFALQKLFNLLQLIRQISSLLLVYRSFKIIKNQVRVNQNREEDQNERQQQLRREDNFDRDLDLNALLYHPDVRDQIQFNRSPLVFQRQLTRRRIVAKFISGFIFLHIFCFFQTIFFFIPFISILRFFIGFWILSPDMSGEVILLYVFKGLFDNFEEGMRRMRNFTVNRLSLLIASTLRLILLWKNYIWADDIQYLSVIIQSVSEQLNVSKRSFWAMINIFIGISLNEGRQNEESN